MSRHGIVDTPLLLAPAFCQEHKAIGRDNHCLVHSATQERFPRTAFLIGALDCCLICRDNGSSALAASDPATRTSSCTPPVMTFLSFRWNIRTSGRLPRRRVVGVVNESVIRRSSPLLIGKPTAEIGFS